MGQLILQGMEFYAYHGHFKEEQVIGGRFLVDLVIETDISKASETDDLDDAIDYSKVYEAIKEQMAHNSKLIENLARRILDAVFTVSDKIRKATVTVSKLNPAIGGNMAKFSVILSDGKK